MAQYGSLKLKSVSFRFQVCIFFYTYFVLFFHKCEKHNKYRQPINWKSKHPRKLLTTILYKKQIAMCL